MSRYMIWMTCYGSWPTSYWTCLSFSLWTKICIIRGQNIKSCLIICQNCLHICCIELFKLFRVTNLTLMVWRSWQCTKMEIQCHLKVCSPCLWNPSFETRVSYAWKWAGQSWRELSLRDLGRAWVEWINKASQWHCLLNDMPCEPCERLHKG